MLPLMIIGTLTGLLFVGIGWILPKNPNLISGYNTLPKHQKQQIDVEKLSKMMKKHLVAMGLLVIVGSIVFSVLKMQWAAILTLLIVPVVGVIYMFIESQQYYPTKSKSFRWVIGVGLALLLSVGALLMYGTQTHKLIVNDTQLEITGMYGLVIQKQSILDVHLLDEIPHIQLRTNGFAMGEVRKGWFQLEEWGKCKLFLQRGAGPYLMIEDKSGNKLIINHKQPEQTVMDYNKILDQLLKNAGN